jgi:hypothetical protein
MVERFNGRIGSEVLGITIYFHRDLEQLLRGFNAAYNARPNPHGRAGPCDTTRARLIAEAAKEVSQPDK